MCRGLHHILGTLGLGNSPSYKGAASKSIQPLPQSKTLHLLFWIVHKSALAQRNKLSLSSSVVCCTNIFKNIIQNLTQKLSQDVQKCEWPLENSHTTTIHTHTHTHSIYMKKVFISINEAFTYNILYYWSLYIILIYYTTLY